MAIGPHFGYILTRSLWPCVPVIPVSWWLAFGRKFLRGLFEVFSHEFLLLFKKSEKIPAPTCAQNRRGGRVRSADSNWVPLQYRLRIIPINQPAAIPKGRFNGNRPGLPLHFDSLHLLHLMQCKTFGGAP